MGKMLDQAPASRFPFEDHIALGCIALNCGADVVTPSGDREDWTEVIQVREDWATKELSQSLNRLIEARWVRLLRPSMIERPCWLRVYLLPYDVGRGQVDRKNKALQRSIQVVLPCISVSPSTWFATHTPDNGDAMFDLWASGDDASLFYIFNTLPSPDPRPNAVDNGYMRSSIRRILDNDQGLSGLKTELYPYQRKAVCSMLQRELVPSMQPDPRFEKRKSVTGMTYFYNSRDQVFNASPRFYDTTRGGILAETMGLGKTLICLATILATRGQYPSIPVQYEEPRLNDGPPSLATAAAAGAIRAGLPWKSFFEEVAEKTGHQHDECIKTMERQSPSYQKPKKFIRSLRDTEFYGKPELVKLASGTIIVVPPNLVHQWEAELKKHTKDGCLKVLVLENKDQLVPPPDELLRYDILLFSKRRFEAESSTSEDLYISPLRALHWLRIIIDEGHAVSSTSTRAAVVAETIVTAERRWVVSGTPSKDLVGVEVSLHAMQVSDLEGASESYRKEVLQARRAYDQAQETDSGAVKSLGSLAARFLKSRPWHASDVDVERPATWDDYIYRHEDFRRRTYSGFSGALRVTLSNLVIKTRPEDVEKDLLLPPLKHTVVRLAPSPLDKMTANLFVLLYTTNAITSERRDRDYLFHNNSRFHLNRLTSNLRQSSFFWVGFARPDIEASLDVGQKYLNKTDINCSVEDRELLLDTMTAAQNVLDSAVWRGLSESQEMGVFLNRWPEHSQDGWLFRDCRKPPTIGLGQLIQVQKYINRHLAAENPWDGLGNIMPSSSDSEMPGPLGNEPANDLQMAKNGVPSATLGDNFRPKALRKSQTQNAKRKPKVSNEIRISEMDSRLKTADDASPMKATSTERKMAQESKKVLLGSDSDLGLLQIVGTASSKLSYLVDRILELQTDEKILVFYDGGHIAFYVSQLLDLLHVKHLIYANTLSSDARSKYIVLFDTDPTQRVLLMDIRQAARGLNVSSASRVFFINPPCQPDVEAQAIKRAHRIGQTKPVHVETLVLKGTVEEAIHDQALRMTQREHSSAKALEDNESIRNVIQSAKVIPLSVDEVSGSGQMAPLRTPQQIFGRPGRIPQKSDGLEAEIFGAQDDELTPPRKKRLKTRKVAFEDEAHRSSNEESPSATSPKGSMSFSLFGGD